jgi:hypothetical protein
VGTLSDTCSSARLAPDRAEAGATVEVMASALARRTGHAALFAKANTATL